MADTPSSANWAMPPKPNLSGDMKFTNTLPNGYRLPYDSLGAQLLDAFQQSRILPGAPGGPVSNNRYNFQNFAPAWPGGGYKLPGGNLSPGGGANPGNPQPGQGAPMAQSPAQPQGMGQSGGLQGLLGMLQSMFAGGASPQGNRPTSAGLLSGNAPGSFGAVNAQGGNPLSRTGPNAGFTQDAKGNWIGVSGRGYGTGKIVTGDAAGGYYDPVTGMSKAGYFRTDNGEFPTLSPEGMVAYRVGAGRYGYMPVPQGGK